MLCELNRVRLGPDPFRSWGEVLGSARDRLAPLVGAGADRRILFVVADPLQALEAVVLGLRLGLDFGILDRARLSAELGQRLDDHGLVRIDVAGGSRGEPASPAEAVPGRVTVLTSGTTGAAKLVEHRWDSLNTLVRARRAPARVWFVPYQAGSYAWYQMMCLGLFTPGQDLACGDPADLFESFSDALRRGVTAVSSTPTFWRYAMMALDEGVLRAAAIRTISLGGEIVDQALLDRLAELYPGAQIRHIYASSEAGAAIVVEDGRAGFPAERLGDGSAVGLKVDGGRLFVRSPFTTAAAGGRPDAWVDTGDLVELRGGRVHFLGRDQTAMINVGGAKVCPADVEAVLLSHPKVRWAQVFARRAPLAGALPAARVVLSEPAADAASAEAELAAFARTAMPSHAVPRFWQFVTEIPVKASLKS